MTYGDFLFTGVRFFDPSLESIKTFIEALNAQVFELSEEQIENAVTENGLTLDLALIYDSVTLYTTALNIIGIEAGAEVTCEEDVAWSMGSSIVNFVRTVSDQIFKHFYIISHDVPCEKLQ